MLEIRNLYKNYGNFQAVCDLNLSIRKGELFGFVGHNGAGKTTTMKIIAGLLTATSGSITVNGVDAIHNKKEIKQMIGYMPDFFGVYDNLRAIEYMEFYASMYGIKGPNVRQSCRNLMELVNLADKERAYVDSLSRGMKQRLCLARCLVHNPELLLLDEPASGLDPQARFEMKEILKNLSAMGKTIIISSHILPELADMCTTVGIMKQGHMLLNGPVDEILSHAERGTTLDIRVLTNQETAVRILKEDPHVHKVSILESELNIEYSGNEYDLAQLMRMLVLNNVLISGFHKEKGNLETLFLEVTGDLHNANH